MSYLYPSKALEEQLGGQALTHYVRTFADQRAERTLTGLFQTSARPLMPEDDTATWDEFRFSRHLAPVVGRDAPHPLATLLAPKRRLCAMASIKIYKDLPAPYLFFDMAPGRDTIEQAVDVLMNELADMGNLILNTREWLAAGALQGLIDVNQRTLPGSELTLRIEFGNRRADAAASWKDPLTKIRAHELIVVKRLYKDMAGVSPGVVLAGQDVEGYLTTNLDVRGLAVARLGGAILAGQQPDGKNPFADLGGMSWRFADGTYKPEGGPVTRYFAKDTLVVLPPAAQLQGVLGWAEGRVLVPKGPVYTNQPLRALDFIEEKRGAYAYAEVRTDPLGIRVYAGWRGLPVILNPDAVLVYRVVPAGSTP